MIKMANKTKNDIVKTDAQVFENLFDEKVIEVENQIDVGRQVTNDFDIGKVRFSIQELQQLLTNSTLFLTDYKVNSCQNTIKRLLQDYEVIINLRRPKKKFEFKKKSIPLESSVNKLATNKICNPESKIVTNLFQNTIVNKRCEYIIMNSEDICNKDISLMNIESCVVEIRGTPGSIQLNNIKNSVILSGPVLRAVFIEFAINSSFAVACQQLRVHSSSNCFLAVYVTARAIIEDCKAIMFSKFNYEYENIQNDFVKSDLQSKNNYQDIADFNWLSSEIPSPNWSLSEESRDWKQTIQKHCEENNINQIT